LRPWTRDAAISFLRTPVEVRALIEAAGCWVRAWGGRDGGDRWVRA
jgi:hypothetical protein